MTQPRILLVDDDTALLRLLTLRLGQSGYEVTTAESGESALLQVSQQKPDVVVTDLRMAGMDGLALFDRLQQDQPSLPVIVLTAHGSIPGAVEATRRGVFSYLTKPFDSAELLAALDLAVQQRPDYRGNPQAGLWREQILTQSSLMEELLDQAGRVAGSEVSVLIQGASGTGKEVLAQAIHKASPRHTRPFVPINCAAIPDNLLESELFGHRKGAFTGADKHHTGLFQLADGGTLFLDEIGDMPLDFQAKLLRALEERRIRPVGSGESIPIDIRLISATHVDLEKAVAEKTFREDLFYRLNVVMLEIPPLAERREDIPLLARHFLTRLKQANTGIIAQSFAPEAMDRLLQAPWPGNIRQLLNVVEQVAVLATAPVINGAAIDKALRGKTGRIPSLADASLDFEREYLVSILRATRGNVTRAAELANRNRTEFYKLLKRHKLQAQTFRSA